MLYRNSKNLVLVAEQPQHLDACGLGAVQLLFINLLWSPRAATNLFQHRSGGAEMSRETGVVKWFSRLKGYGFINPDDGGQEVFVHYSAIEGDGYRNLYEGDRVEFEMVDQGKGPQAQKVVTRRT